VLGAARRDCGGLYLMRELPLGSKPGSPAWPCAHRDVAWRPAVASGSTCPLQVRLAGAHVDSAAGGAARHMGDAQLAAGVGRHKPTISRRGRAR